MLFLSKDLVKELPVSDQTPKEVFLSFTENSRIEIPARIHLTRSGYMYIFLKGQTINPEINIFIDIFYQALNKINGAYYDHGSILFALQFLSHFFFSGMPIPEIKESLGPDNLGKTFYRHLQEGIPVYEISDKIKFIYFKDHQNYSLHMITESTYKNEDDGFCTDITFLINGMPLVFITVKKQNGIEGIIAKRKQMEVRSKINKFRNFITTTQIVAFSINMRYDDNDMVQIHAVYYTSCNYHYDLFLLVFMNEWAVKK
jgi:type I restriction enzyme R subunit